MGGGIAGTGTINKTNGGIFTLDSGSDSSGFTGTFTEDEGTVNVAGVFFGGTNTINDGILNWLAGASKVEPSSLQVLGGILNITGELVLNNASSLDTIAENVVVNIAQEGSLNIAGSGNSVTLNSSDTWNGTLSLTGSNGILTLDHVTSTSNTAYNQSNGLLEMLNGTTVTLGGASSITGGNITIDHSTLNTNSIALHLDMNGGNLVMDSGLLNAVDGMINMNTFAGSLTSTGNSNFMVDVEGVSQTSDLFSFSGAISGSVNVSAFNFITSPATEDFAVEVFASPDISGATFTNTQTEVSTVLGNYAISSFNNGWYGFHLTELNDQVLRGPVSTLTVYNGQFGIENMLFDHVYLDSNELTAYCNPESKMFAPYQFIEDKGGVWVKPYANFERLSMSQDLNVQNQLYGFILGVDLPAQTLRNGGKFLPTFFCSYNNGNQTYSHVSMHQNGGQAGFMGTLFREDFIGSVLIYGGGYKNNMYVSDYHDKVANWFAGAAVKAAYNYHPKENLILQPNALATYNIYGKQQWFSDFGSLTMNTGYLNGVGIAPGLNLIYGRETWSAYLTTMYMFNIHDQVSSRANSMELPDIQMRHNGYVEYGVGATKIFKERMMGYFQATLRNGCRTGEALQLGLTCKF